MSILSALIVSSTVKPPLNVPPVKGKKGPPPGASTQVGGASPLDCNNCPDVPYLVAPSIAIDHVGLILNASLLLEVPSLTANIKLLVSPTPPV